MRKAQDVREPRRASEVFFAQNTSLSECITGRYAERGSFSQEIKCKIKAPSAEACGYADWDLVRQKAEEYPHLRPCPKHGWWWVERENCVECENREG